MMINMFIGFDNNSRGQRRGINSKEFLGNKT
jgi:hypothetical protein